MSALFRLSNCGFRYGADPVIEGIGFEMRAAELVAIAGPNGAGKSTLLGVCAGIRAPYEGQCLYRGRDVRHWPKRAFAREVAFVPQNLLVEFPFTAAQVVLMGRAPYGDGLFESAADHEAARRALELTDAGRFAERDFRTLSGGERQRVVLASALAQEPKALLLDEPTTFLDLKHQIAIYELLRRLVRDGMLVVTVTHDLNLALTYADRVLLIGNGRLRSIGDTATVLTEQTIGDIFGLRCELHQRADGRRWVTYG